MAGLVFLATACLAITVFNYFVPKFATNMERKHKKASVYGVVLMLAASAVVFGFLDNYGLKLGVNALEDKVFLGIGKKMMCGSGILVNGSQEKVNELFKTESEKVRDTLWGSTNKNSLKTMKNKLLVFF